MMTSLKVVLVAICILQTAGSSSSLRGDAAETRELMAGGAPTASAPQPSPGGASIPAHDGTDKAPASHHAKEATSSEKSEHSPWSQDDIVTLVTVLGVVFLIFAICLSFATYKVSQREAKTQEKAAPAPQTIGDTEEKKFGHVFSDASTAASDTPAVL